MGKLCLALASLLVIIPILITGCSSPRDTGTLSEFQIISVDVLPQVIEAGETAEIIVVVKNSGKVAGTDVLKLLVDGATADVRETETISPGSSVAVKFLLQKNEPGEYTLTVGDSNFTLTVREAAQTPEQSSVANITPVKTTTTKPETPTPTPNPEFTFLNESGKYELRYEDGSISGLSIRFPLYGYSVQFVSPDSSFMIEEIRVSVTPAPGWIAIEDTDAEIEIRDVDRNIIWLKSLAELEYSLDYTFDGNWICIYPEIEVSGVFSVVFYTNFNAESIAINYSTQKNNYASKIVNEGNGKPVSVNNWPQDVDPSTANWMIRVIGE
jgi:hypothetical protein